VKILVGILVVVAILVLSGLVGTLASRDSGYVLLSYGGHEIVTSLWFALGVVIAAWLFIRLILSLLASLFSSGRLFGRWNARRRLKGSKRQTEMGLLLMAEEEWSDARKSLVSGAAGASAPMLNYLQAALASNELGQLKRRDSLLKKATDSTPGAQFAVDLAAARMQLATPDGSEVDSAIEKLVSLRDQAPRHQIVGEFLARAYEKKGDFSALESQLGKLKRMRKEHPEDVVRMETAIGRHKVLDGFANDGDAKGAVAVWKRLDKNVRKDQAFVLEIADKLAGAGAYEEAGDVLVSALNEDWSTALLTRYVDLPEIAKDQAAQAKRWLKTNAKDAGVQLLAARAVAQDGNFAKALEHAEISEQIAPSAAARSEIARAQQATGAADADAVAETGAETGADKADSDPNSNKNNEKAEPGKDEAA